MASKQVVDRQKSADSVIAAGEANVDLIQEALAEKARPFLKKGQPAPDFGAAVRLSCAMLGAAAVRMVEKDEAHEAELGDDAGVREARDEAKAALYSELVDLREILVGGYGGAVAAKVFTGATPEDPVLLARYAGEVADDLEKIKLPRPRLKGAKLDVAEVAASLRDKRAQLEASWKDVQREVREAQQTLDAKNGAMSAYDETFSGVASTLSGLLRLAGKPDLAAKVRPSTRRPGQTAEDAGDTVEPKAPIDK
jgi:hypothetical protein